MRTSSVRLDIDQLPAHPVPQGRALNKAPPDDQVDGGTEQGFQVVAEQDDVPAERTNELDHQVDVAAGLRFPAGDGAEQGQLGNPELLGQRLAMGAKPCEDLRPRQSLLSRCV